MTEEEYIRVSNLEKLIAAKNSLGEIHDKDSDIQLIIKELWKKAEKLQGQIVIDEDSLDE